MDYERIFYNIEEEVETLKIRFGCNSWRSSCLANDVINKAKELKKEIETVTDYEGMSERIDVLLGDKE